VIEPLDPSCNHLAETRVLMELHRDSTLDVIFRGQELSATHDTETGFTRLQIDKQFERVIF
jgi:hypothetical protein